MLAIDQGSDALVIDEGPRADDFELSPSGRNVWPWQRPLPGDYDGDRYLDLIWYAEGKVEDGLWYTQTDGSAGAAVQRIPAGS